MQQSPYLTFPRPLPSTPARHSSPRPPSSMDCLTFSGSQQKNQGLLQAVSTPDSSGSPVRPCSKAQKVLECRLEASGLSLSFCAGATTRRVPCTGQSLPGPHVVSGQQQVSALREKLSWKRLWPGPSPSIRPLSRTEGGFESRW